MQYWRLSTLYKYFSYSLPHFATDCTYVLHIWRPSFFENFTLLFVRHMASVFSYGLRRRRMVSLQTKLQINRGVIWADTGLSDQPWTKLMCYLILWLPLGDRLSETSPANLKIASLGRIIAPRRQFRIQ